MLFRVRCGQGATCEMLPRFDANAVWERIADGSITLFMAVPTIYVKLITAWEAASAGTSRPTQLGVLQATLDGLWLGGATGEYSRTLEGNQRPHTAGALRND